MVAEKLTAVSGGLTWGFANGTWALDNYIEHDLTVIYQILYLVEDEARIFSVIRTDIPEAVREKELDIKHVRIEKGHVTGHHMKI